MQWWRGKSRTIWQEFYLDLSILARMRSMGEGYVFTGVCHSVHNCGGGGFSFLLGLLSELLPEGGLLPQGVGVWSQGVSGQKGWVSTQRGVDVWSEREADPPPMATVVVILLECILGKSLYVCLWKGESHQL